MAGKQVWLLRIKMKACLTLFCWLFSVCISFAVTWTFHGTKDNYSIVYILSGLGPGPGYDPLGVMQWDWNYDQEFPQWADSGLATTRDAQGNYIWSGYSDSLTLTTPDKTAWVSEIDLSGPADNYSGRVSIWSNPVESIVPPGEYWLDFDSTGTIRLSTTQPSDFGKWAWDGSLNPSWVEPLAVHGKGKALGHGK